MQPFPVNHCTIGFDKWRYADQPSFPMKIFLTFRSHFLSDEWQNPAHLIIVARAPIKSHVLPTKNKRPPFRRSPEHKFHHIIIQDSETKKPRSWEYQTLHQ